MTGNAPSMIVTEREPFIHLHDIRKEYRRDDGEPFLAVSNATFDVEAGELVALVGPSGCGKTTLLKILAGLHTADGGELSIGNPATPFTPGKDVGMVFQQPLLLKWRTILENVLLPAEILGLPLKASRERARDLLALVGLAGREDARPYELSGGMQQRAAIARALVHDPQLVLMDEPFGALDEFTRNKLDDDLVRLSTERRLTTVFVTHSLYEAVFLSTRVVVMAAQPGRIFSEFVVSEPPSRSEEFRTSERFAQQCRALSEILTAAAHAGGNEQHA
jgi:NitT/TauT family transport system ATP-binding protein